VIVDPSLIEQLLPDLLGEPAMEDAVAVQVAELATTHGEGELAPAAGARLDAGPRGDLLGDAFAGGLVLGGHGSILALVTLGTPNYKFK
jgi:hypothetical protein